jgi:hypothetical protein
MESAKRYGRECWIIQETNVIPYLYGACILSEIFMGFLKVEPLMD